MTVTCYECAKPAVELNENSRCIHCVTKRNFFNEKENTKLRHQIATLQRQLNRKGGK